LRNWTRVPAKPLRYHWCDRMVDGRNGCREGKAGLMGETGWQRALRRPAAEQVNAEHVAGQQNLADLTDRRNVAASPIESPRGEVVRLELDLAAGDRVVATCAGQRRGLHHTVFDLGCLALLTAVFTSLAIWRLGRRLR